MVGDNDAMQCVALVVAASCVCQKQFTWHLVSFDLCHERNKALGKVIRFTDKFEMLRLVHFFDDAFRPFQIQRSDGAVH